MTTPSVVRSVPMAADAPAILQTLLPAATEALHAEDQLLSGLFARATKQDRQRSHGLTYWVFETSLVYTIFKAWIPQTEVEWEFPYPHSAEKADLVVFDAGRPALVFEAKWWMNNQRKTLAALRDDVDKVLRWPDPDGRYCLRFGTRRAPTSTGTRTFARCMPSAMLRRTLR